MNLKRASRAGCLAAFRKFALGPPTQVDQFVADIEAGKDVPPEAAMPPMAGAPGGLLPALDGTTPLQLPPPPQPMPPQGPPGSTVAPEMAAAQGQPPPSMGMLGG